MAASIRVQAGEMLIADLVAVDLIRSLKRKRCGEVKRTVRRP